MKMIQIHFMESKKHALGLLAVLSTRFPHEFSGEYVELVTQKIFDFAFHARRLVELVLIDCTSHEIPFKETLFDGLDKPLAEKLCWNFGYFLNYLVHCRSYEIGVGTWAGPKIYYAFERESYIAYISVETDLHEERVFYLFSMVNHFLTQICPKFGLRGLQV